MLRYKNTIHLSELQKYFRLNEKATQTFLGHLTSHKKIYFCAKFNLHVPTPDIFTDN